MYGIYFQSHPNLRKILTNYDFVSYPLWKDSPLLGYVDLRSNNVKKRVAMEPIQLA